IGTGSNFFKLGGHSLRAVRLISGIQKALNVEVPLNQIFQFPTIKELSAYIKGLTQKKHISIPPAEKRDYYPLSSAQRRLYVLQQMDPTATAYNMPTAWVIEGAADKNRLETAFLKLIRRHESLRTSFLSLDGQPVQIMHDHVDFEIEFYGRGEPLCSPLNGNKGRNKGNHRGLPLQDFVRPFDLSHAPILRVGLIMEEETKYILVVDMHHVISDGLSAEILVEDFMGLYGGSELPGLPVHYKDFARWQGSPDVQASLERQQTYWLNEFAGEIPVLTLPTDYVRPSVKSYEGGEVCFPLEPVHAQSLKDLALTGGATFYTVLLSLYAILLSRLSGQEDIVIGAPVAGRNHSDLEPIMGMFVNTLPLRNALSPEETFDRFLQSIKTKTLSAFSHQDCLYEDLVEALVKDRDTSRNPLFDTVFVLQNTDIQDLQLPGLRLVPYHRKGRVSKFDLTLEAVEREGNLFFTFEYSAHLFRRETIERFTRYFKKIISGVLQEPGMKISGIQLISEDEKKQLLYDFNDTQTTYPRDKTVHQLFAEQVDKNPDTIAVVGMENHSVLSVSYKELHHRSDRLALELTNTGLKPGTDSIVAIMSDRSVETIIGVLGILKAGGAYLPIDPNWPEERIDYMLKDSGAKVTLGTGNVSNSGSFYSPLERGGSPKARRGALSTEQRGTSPNSLAYIIYTSGSTGNPKGTMVEHRNIIRLVCNTNYVAFKPGDKILQTGALSFDASTFEIWGSLLNGMVLYLMSKERVISPRWLKWGTINLGITTMWMTAPLFNQMLDEDIGIFSGLRNLLVGGDVLSPVHINRLRDQYPQLNIINGYGPTENTTFSTTHLIKQDYNSQIPIGKPIANSTVYILDKNNRPQPIGVVGELCVGGDGVSRGYLNNPELTANKFDHDFKDWKDDQDLKKEKKETSTSSAVKIKLYKTGDLARWLPDGIIEFLGRADTQVKVRGFRVELEEIENRLK
ncbi:MAG: amino acid adenylation domain-containing protein, partial [bacterium]|nr:amino acid adenylation domain-containing protein [bacterium]